MYLVSYSLHLFKGQESDELSDDLEDLDLDLEDSPDDDRYLLNTATVEKRLRNEINRQNHDNYVHFDIIDADGGIEVFCLDSLYRKSRVNQLKNALKRITVKNVGRKKNLRNQIRCSGSGSRRRCGPIWTNEYHHIKMFNCDIFCPESICPN